MRTGKPLKKNPIAETYDAVRAAVRARQLVRFQACHRNFRPSASAAPGAGLRGQSFSPSHASDMVSRHSDERTVKTIHSISSLKDQHDGA